MWPENEESPNDIIRGKFGEIAISLEESELGVMIFDRMEQLFSHPSVGNVTNLSIGNWGMCWEEDSTTVVTLLVESANKLPNLKTLSIGQVEPGECERSWILQSDMTPIWSAFPKLEYFHIEGGSGLSLGKIRHERLKTLCIITAGLDGAVVRQIAAAELPSLERLDLGLGCRQSGASVTINDIRAVLDRFPNLKSLGLSNSELGDEIAAMIANSPILDSLVSLDLSCGTLSDQGMAELLSSPKIRILKNLDVSWSYLSDEMVKRLEDAPFSVNTEAQRIDFSETVDGKVQNRRYVLIYE